MGMYVVIPQVYISIRSLNTLAVSKGETFTKCNSGVAGSILGHMTVDIRH